MQAATPHAYKIDTDHFVNLYTENEMRMYI